MIKEAANTRQEQDPNRASEWDMTPPAADNESDFESDVENLTPKAPEIASSYRPSAEKMSELRIIAKQRVRGERSLLAFSDGESQLISDYHDVITKYGFDESEALQQDSTLLEVLDELADDVATVDATRGDVLDDPEFGSKFYDNLRMILEYRDDGATPAEKSVINDFLGTLNGMGNALALMLFRMEQDTVAEEATEEPEPESEPEPATPEFNYSTVDENAEPGPYGIEPTYDNPAAFENLRYTPERFSRGQQSVFITGTNSEGERSSTLCSEYMDHTAHSEHLVDIPAIKADRDLVIAIDGLTFNLALIDATRGRNLTEEDAPSYAKNFLTIQRWLDKHPEETEACDAIQAYLDKLRSMGPALSAIEQIAANQPAEDMPEDKEDDEANERAERRHRIEAMLEEIEEVITKTENARKEAEKELAQLRNRLSDTVEDWRNIDTEEMYHYERRIGEKLEELDSIISQLGQQYDDVATTTIRNAELFTEEEQTAARRKTYQREETIKQYHTRQFNRHDGLDDIRRRTSYISDIHDNRHASADDLYDLRRYVAQIKERLHNY